MSQPGARNWWEMTGGELEAMNRTRCGDLPFGGRDDPTCARFRIESLGIGAPDTDANRTSEPSLGTRLGFALMGIPGAGPAVQAGAAVGTSTKSAIDAYIPNIVLILIGIVMLFAGVMLWGRFSGDAIARYGRKLASEA
jgi:hypothetical protein